MENIKFALIIAAFFGIVHLGNQTYKPGDRSPASLGPDYAELQLSEYKA